MKSSLLPTVTMTEVRWKLLIAAFSCIAILLTMYCLSQGITIIFMHSYYIPIVFLAYHYRRRGFLGILILTLAYLALVCVFEWGNWIVLAGSVARAFVFVAIGALLIYLSENLVRTREALSESLQVQTSIIQNANVWLMVLDNHSRILEWNTAAETISGYKAGEVMGKNEIWKFLYPEEEYRREITGNIADIIRNEDFLENLKTRITCKDGSQKIILWNTKKLPQQAEYPDRFIAIGIDVTRTSEAEERFRTLFENMLDGFAYCQMLYKNGKPDDFLYIRVNKAFERLTGLRKVVGKRATEAIPAIKEETPELFEIYARVAETGNPEQFEINFTPLDVQLFISVYSPEKGYFVAIFENITERTRAEEALRKSEEQLALAIEGSGVGLWDWHVQTGDVEYNERWAEIAGYTLEELAPVSINTWTRLCHPDDLSRSEVLLREHFEKRSPMYECEVRIRHKDGRWIWILDRGTVVEWDAEGRPIRMTGTHLDINTRKQIEDALRMANKKLNLLSSITRHDIINQLAALMGYLELSEDYKVDPTLQTYLDRMKTVSRVIQKQIDFTRVYQDIGVIEPTWQNIHATITRMAQSLNMGDVRIEETDTNVEVLADPLLEKVFYNLFDNALRYGEKITRIRCSSEKRDDTLLIVVEDDGVGVSSQDKNRIFDRGFGKHTGFGLFLSKEILAITGISITENGESGNGARFEITVPNGGFRFH
ncbi:MAG: PAS domain S-box protein [Methanolinea sp.]